MSASFLEFRAKPSNRWRITLSSVFDHLLRLHEPPQRIAASFAVGVFFSFSPFFGLQSLSALGCAFLFKLNRAAVFLGLWANLPWIMVPWYTLTTIAGATLLGVKLPAAYDQQLRDLFNLSWFQPASWRQALVFLRPLFVSLIAGATISAALVAAAAYGVSLRVIERRRAKANR